MSKNRKYVVGHRETGVLFVLTNPLRTILVERSDIERQAEAAGRSFDEVFDEYAAGATAAHAGVRQAPAKAGAGAEIGDVDFCFVAETDGERLFSARQSGAPSLQSTLDDRSGPAAGDVDFCFVAETDGERLLSARQSGAPSLQSTLADRSGPAAGDVDFCFVAETDGERLLSARQSGAPSLRAPVGDTAYAAI